MAEIIIPITLFASIFGIIYIFFMTRNKERLAMIDKGMDVSLLSKRQGGQSPLNFWVIKIGFLMIGLALGIIVATIAENNGMNGDQAYPAMILLFGGLALIASYFVELKLRAKSKD